MATQAELEARLDALKRARDQGASTIEYVSGGNQRRLTYRSVDELNKAIAAVEQELANANGTAIVRRFYFPVSDKGY